MESKINRYKKQLYKKEKILNYLLTCRTNYIKLFDYEQRQVEDIMFNSCEKLQQIKSTIENTNIRYRSYLILRMINRTSSEMLEIIMLIVATSQGYHTRKANKKCRYADILIDGEKWDIKLYWNGLSPDGKMMHKSPRDYNQNKIIFDFGEDKKKEILRNFVGYFRKRNKFLWEILEGIRHREYKTIRIHEMCYIQSTPWV